MQSEPVKKLKAFADTHEETQGQFTISDEKVRRPHGPEGTPDAKQRYRFQEHNVFMRVDVSPPLRATRFLCSLPKAS